MELDPLAQLEGIGQAVIGDRPALGQAGFDDAVLVDAGQPFHDVGIDHFIDCGGGAGGWVEMRRLQAHAEDEGVLCRQGRRREGQAAGRNRTGGEVDQVRFHRAFSLGSIEEVTFYDAVPESKAIVAVAMTFAELTMSSMTMNSSG